MTDHYPTDTIEIEIVPPKKLRVANLPTGTPVQTGDEVCFVCPNGRSFATIKSRSDLQHGMKDPLEPDYIVYITSRKREPSQRFELLTGNGGRFIVWGWSINYGHKVQHSQIVAMWDDGDDCIKLLNGCIQSTWDHIVLLDTERDNHIQFVKVDG